MYSVELRAGRLPEVRLRSSLLAEEVHAFRADALARSRGTEARIVSCVDMRALRLLGPEVSEALVEVLRGTNPRIERTACLLPEGNATLLLQIERLHREARNPARRTFRDAGELQRWLAEVLTGIERKRLAAFLEAE